MRLALACLVIAFVTLLPQAASAHAVGLSSGDYRVAGAAVQAQYVFSSLELASSLPGLDTDHDGRLSAAELARAARPLETRIVRATHVASDGKPCAPRLDAMGVGEGDAVAIRATFACDHAPRSLTVTCDFIDVFTPGHRHLATVGGTGNEASFVLVSAQKRVQFDFGAAPLAGDPRAAAFGAMVWTGITHIWTGYDHLAFLLGLILTAGRIRTLIGVLSAFTVAHSITLALAVLGIASLRPAFVEPAIALSVAYVGVENLVGADPSKRWRIAFPFGLLHGFGFAGALTSLELPRARIPVALFAFNLGVELGQLLVLALVLPLILRARHAAMFRTVGVRVLSGALVVAGSVWFVLRVVG